MHNGSISSFLTIRRSITAQMSSAVYANIHGSTDSEHLAGLYMTYLTSSGPESSFEKTYSLEEMNSAMCKTIETVITLQKTLIENSDGKRTPNSLNLCTTDGLSLLAYRFRNHATSQPPTLYYSTSAGKTLNRKFLDHPDGVTIKGVTDVGLELEGGMHGRHVIVASEPSTYLEEEWELVGRNCWVGVGEEGRVVVGEVGYPEDWDAL